MNPQYPAGAAIQPSPQHVGLNKAVRLEDITAAIVAEIERVRGDVVPAGLNFARGERCDTGNQYCLFLKPWTTRPGADLTAVLRLVFERAAAYGLEADEIAVLPGRYLRDRGIMSEHYWRMDAFARLGAAAFTPAIRDRFKAAFGIDPDEAVILGGAELLDRYPKLSPLGLEMLWENVTQQRLGNSVTCARVTVGGNDMFVINGFVPNLLATYEQPENVVTVLSLRGPLSWRDARQLFVGATDPAHAAEGSLRKLLFQRRDALGIDIRLGANGVHLSAGPLEAVTELRRLLPASAPERTRPVDDFQFGRKLIAAFGVEMAAALLANPAVSVDGEEHELFALTQAIDEDPALELLSQLKDVLSGAAAS